MHAAAGPDRRAEIDQQRRTAVDGADAARALAEAGTRLAGLTAERRLAAEALEGAEAARRQAQQPRFLRRPDRQLLSHADDAVSAALRRVHDADHAVSQAAEVLGDARRHHDRAERVLRALHEVETAQAARQAWLRAHPEATDHLAEMARKIWAAQAETRSQTSGTGGRDQGARTRPPSSGTGATARRAAVLRRVHEPAGSDPWRDNQPSSGRGPEL